IAASELFDSTANPNRNLAEKLIKTVSDTFGHTNRGVKYRYDDKGDNWYGILRNSKAEHAMLLEHGFHTGRSDVEKLLDFNFLKKLAAAEARTLAEYYGLR
ncbi:MAG: N-acetylmuramoyl-L-alanine amidase, partial [Bacillota bacterium]|nr:N-acetylmuramoyl-L-alanine amidase [Bacillota bacterium]